MQKSCCFFLIWDDGFDDELSFLKSMDNILPLPKDMKINSDASPYLGGGKGHKRLGDGVGRGKPRN